MKNLLAALPIIALAFAYARAEEASPAKAVLDRAEAARSLQMGGGQAMAEFWDTCEEETEVEFRSESEVDGKKQESKTVYRIVKRAGDSLTLSVTANGKENRIDLRRREAAHGPDPRFPEPPVDGELPARETLQIGDRKFDCRVFERTEKSFPLCGTKEPQYRVLRTTAWHCAGVEIQGGVLKIVTTWEENWGEGLKPVQSEVLTVTDAAAKRMLGNIEIDGYTVSVVGKRGDVVWREATQWRKDTTPGGVFEATEKTRSSDGAGPWRTDHHWIERMSLVRTTTREKK